MPVVIAATERGLVRLTGDDGGERLHDTDIAAAAPGDDGWWLADDDNRILRIRDGAADVGEIDGPPVTALEADGDAVLAGTRGGHLYRVTDGSAARITSFDEVRGRGEWYTPWGAPPAVRSITGGPGGTWYVNVHVGGIVRSRDGGATWEPTVDIDVDVHEVVADAASGLVLAAAGAGGLLVSADGGNTWHRRTEGLHATYCRAVAAAGDTVLVTASHGPGGRDAAVYRGPLAVTGTLTRCLEGLPATMDGNVDTGLLAATGPVATVVTPDGDCYVSEDAGRSWYRHGAIRAPRRIAVTAGDHER